MFFYKKRPELEKEILARTNTFIKDIKNSPDLSKFIEVFGITGPAARGQATHKGSDIDFYCITSKLSPLKSIWIRNKFVKLFNNLPVDVELLIFSPKIYKKPDLMYFEFSSSGKVLYGKLRKKAKISQIPKWESMQILTYRGGPFLNAHSNRNIDYEYSKLILGIGEALLLISGEYIADNHKRSNRVISNNLAKKIPGFISEHNKAYNFRYKDKSFGENKSKLISNGNHFLRLAWKQIMEIYFDRNYIDAINELKKIKPNLFINLGNIIFYTFNNLRFNNKLKFSFRNPYVREILLTQQYLSNPRKYSKLRSEICLSWKTAPRFWRKD